MNWKYILIVIILAVIVGGGILAYQYWWLPKEEAKAPEEIVKDETANWKTYRNEEYGFEVRYPPDWFVMDYCLYEEGCSYKFISFGEGPTLDNEGRIIRLKKEGFNIRRHNDVGELWENEKERLSLRDWIFKNFLLSGEEELIKVICVGRDECLREPNGYLERGIYLDLIPPNGYLIKKYKGVGIIHLINYVFIQKNSFVYEITGEVLTSANIDFPTKYNYEKVFNQMLSTFRFLE